MYLILLLACWGLAAAQSSGYQQCKCGQLGVQDQIGKYGPECHTKNTNDEIRSFVMPVPFDPDEDFASWSVVQSGPDKGKVMSSDKKWLCDVVPLKKKMPCDGKTQGSACTSATVAAGGKCTSIGGTLTCVGGPCAGKKSGDACTASAGTGKCVISGNSLQCVVSPPKLPCTGVRVGGSCKTTANIAGKCTLVGGKTVCVPGPCGGKNAGDICSSPKGIGSCTVSGSPATLTCVPYSGPVAVWKCTPAGGQWVIPPAQAKILAQYTSRVKITPTSGDNPNYTVYSRPGGYVDGNLRVGKGLAHPVAGGMPIVTDWTTSTTTASKRLWATCGQSGVGSIWSAQHWYWACNNEGGIHLTSSACGWTYPGKGKPYKDSISIFFEINPGSSQCVGKAVGTPCGSGGKCTKIGASNTCITGTCAGRAVGYPCGKLSRCAVSGTTLTCQRYKGWLKVWQCSGDNKAIPTHGFTMPVNTAKMLIQNARQVKISPTSGDNPAYTVVSKPNGYVAKNLKVGKGLGHPVTGGNAKVSDWTGTPQALKRLGNSCGASNPGDLYVGNWYWACNNGNGLHIVSNACGWDTKKPWTQKISVFVYIP